MSVDVRGLLRVDSALRFAVRGLLHFCGICACELGEICTELTTLGFHLQTPVRETFLLAASFLLSARHDVDHLLPFRSRALTLASCE